VYEGGYKSSYRSTAAPAPAPEKKQTYDEAFPTLGSAPTVAVPTARAETETRAPTLAEKLRKKAAEEAEVEERRKAAADAAALRYAREAKERAMFASLSASRAYMGASHYMNGYGEDDTHGYGEGDDLDYGAFGEAVEKPLTRRAPTPVTEHDYDDDGY
jgi:membrane protein involved in colicin uptake